VKRLVLGSVAERVVHSARCPVYVVRRKDHLEVADVPEIEPPCKECLLVRALNTPSSAAGPVRSPSPGANRPPRFESATA
jgi:hypothetical protein